MLMPCRSFDNGSEDVVINCHGRAGVDDENSGDDVSSDEDYIDEDQYTQLADFTGNGCKFLLFLSVINPTLDI
jgi:hypothetical protein